MRCSATLRKCWINVCGCAYEGLCVTLILGLQQKRQFSQYLYLLILLHYFSLKKNQMKAKQITRRSVLMDNQASVLSLATMSPLATDTTLCKQRADRENWKRRCDTSQNHCDCVCSLITKLTCYNSRLLNWQPDYIVWYISHTLSYMEYKHTIGVDSRPRQHWAGVWRTKAQWKTGWLD